MNSPLILIAASARAIASMAHRAGFSPWSVDLFGDVDLQRLGPTQQIAAFSDIGSTVADRFPTADWLYGGAFENHPDLIDQLASQRRLLGNDGATVRRVRDPLALQIALAKSGFNFPETVAQPTCDARWLRKPQRSGGGQGIRFADQTYQRPLGDAYVWQRHIDGISCSALYVAAGGQCRLLMTSEQLLGAAWNTAEPFAYVGSAMLAADFASIEHQLRALGGMLAAEFRLQGIFGVDFVRAGDHVWTVEVNPRLTASAELLLRISNLNPVALHVAACRDGLLPADDAFRTVLPQHVGKAVVFAPSDARASERLADHIERCNAEREHPAIADIPALGTILLQGQPIVTVFAEADRRDDLLSKLRAATAAVVDALDIS